MELISQNNKEVFNLNTQFTKLRNELEKSEAQRQTLEYELTLARNSLYKANNEREKYAQETSKKYEGKI